MLRQTPGFSVSGSADEARPIISPGDIRCAPRTADMWLSGSQTSNHNHNNSKNKNCNDNNSNNSNDISESNSIFSGASATTILAAAAAKLASGAGAAASVAELQPSPSQQLSSPNHYPRHNQAPISKASDTRPTTGSRLAATSTTTQGSSSGSSTDSGQQKVGPAIRTTTPELSSNVQQESAMSSGHSTHPADRPERISFHLKASIFTRRVTIDRDEMALGSIKQLAIAFLNEVFFQHSYPTNTYIGDYIREHYGNVNDLSHLYERLILRKYCRAQDCFVPFNSVSDIEPESFISIEVAERTSRHLLMNNNNNNNISNTNSKQTPSLALVDGLSPGVANQSSMFLSPNVSAQQQQQQVNLSAATNSPAMTSTTQAGFGGSSAGRGNISSLSSSASSSSVLVTATNLIRMTHDFKQETYLKFTYCASCSNLIKGIIFQGYQCRNCKKNYCCDCKTKAESPGSSDSCLAPVNSANLIGGSSSSSSSISPLSNLFASSRNNNNSIDTAAGTTTMATNANNPASPSGSTPSNKLEISHTNMSKRKSASNLLQQLNLANPFKTHHNNQHQPHTPKVDKPKMRGSAGALEPVLHQLSKQREQQQLTYDETPPAPSGGGGGNNTNNTLLVAQTTQLSSSHQNLFMNGQGTSSGGQRSSDCMQTGVGGSQDHDDDDNHSAASPSLQRLSNSARTSATDLHATSTTNKTATKRDLANHSFTTIDSEGQRSALDGQHCDVCNKSLKSGQQQQQQQQEPLICKSCKLYVHSHCQNLVLTDCLSRIAESSRAAAATATVAMDEDSGLSVAELGSGEKSGIRNTNSNVSRDNIRLHRLAPSVKHVKRPDLTRPILEGWLKHTTLSSEQARQHYWRLDETDLTLYENDKSTRYFKAIALSKITRVMSSQSLPKQIREDVLLTNELLNPTNAASSSGAAKKQPSNPANEQPATGKARSATTSPIKTPELQAQMKAMFAFELATGSMYLVQAQSESEASKWRELLANVTGKTNQPEDKQHQVAGSPAKQAEREQPQMAAVDKLVETVNRIDLEPDKADDGKLAQTKADEQSKLSDDKSITGPPSAVVGVKQAPKQPAVQRQHHHRYPPSGHRMANFTDPNRSRLYNRPRKEIQLNKMDIPDHLIEAKYLIEKDHNKGSGFVELGSGQFGKVYAAISEYKLVDSEKSIWSGVPVAIKEISKARFDLKQQEKLKNEASILSILDHPGVIILERVHDLQDKIYIVMEQLEDDMLEMIVSTPEKRLNERVTKFLTYQILEALRYLHQRQIAHCDLKPENVLLVDKHTYPQIKLCDFGFAKIIEENSFRCSLVGTPAYLAPEVVKGERYNRSVDLWSVGVIVYVSLSGEFPFNEGENIHDQISRANFMYPKQIWGNISQQAMNFINSLLRVNRDRRLSASTAQMDVWIQDYQLWCDLSDLELRVGKRWVTDYADYKRWSQYAKENGLRIPNSAAQLHMGLKFD